MKKVIEKEFYEMSQFFDISKQKISVEKSIA